MKSCKYYGRYTDDLYIIHEDKEFLKQLLKEIQQIANGLGLIINPKKTHLCKLSQNFRILQLQYQLTSTGRVVRKIHPKSVTRERRKLKAYKRLLDNNKLTYKEIENMFKSWMASNYKNMSRLQIKNMTQLYYNLFGEVPKWNKQGYGKLRWLMKQSLKT